MTVWIGVESGDLDLVWGCLSGFSEGVVEREIATIHLRIHWFREEQTIWRGGAQEIFAKKGKKMVHRSLVIGHWF